MNGNARRKEHALESYVKKNGSLDYIRANDVQFLTVRIFKDIVYGNLGPKEIEKYAAFFTDANNIDNMLIIISNKRNEAAVICNGINAYINTSPNPENTSQAINEIHRKWYSIYSLYENIAQALTVLKGNGDIRILYGLGSTLAPLKRFFNS